MLIISKDSESRLIFRFDNNSVPINSLTSEHVLSGKCMAKKKNGEGYCSRKQLPNKLYCKQHLEENRFRIKKQG